MLSIKSFKLTIIMLFTALACGEANAQSAQQINAHPANFTLDTPFNVVASQDEPQSEAFAKKISAFVRRQKLATATTSNITSRRNIIITQKEQIGQYTKEVDCYLLKVTKDNIFIQYTTSTALFWAYDAFVSKFKVKESFFQKMMKKRKCYIEAYEIISTEGEESGTDLVRLVSNPLTIDKIKERIEKSLGSNITTLFVELISVNGCALKCHTIDLFNPNASYTIPTAISVAQFEELNQFASNLGVTLIPIVELSAENNKPLTEFTGHPVHSAEGLRFSKSLLKELCDGTTVSTICIGKKQTDSLIQAKYTTPLVELLHKYGKRAVVQ